jgi:hypothetical protein
MATLTYRQKKRALALARQLYAAGLWYYNPTSSDELYFYATPRSRAERIIAGQMKTLRLTQEVIDAALRMVEIVN